MKDFFESIKKLLKIIVVLALVVIGISGLYVGYNYYSDKVENTIDEEIGLMCQSPKDEEKYIRIILASSPKSRATSKYYDLGYVLGYEQSEIDDTKEALLQPLHIDKRTIDYVYADALFGLSVKLNRKTLELSIIEKSHVDTGKYKVAQVNQCVEVDPQVVRDKVVQVNTEAKQSNKL